MDTWENLRVRDMLAIPCQQILYPVVRDSSDMKRIDGSFLRQDPAVHHLVRYLVNFGIAG